MRYRFDVLASGETRWSNNSITYDTREAAEAAARDLYGRWMLVDKASVVPVDTPTREPYVAGGREEVAL